MIHDPIALLLLFAAALCFSISIAMHLANPYVQLLGSKFQQRCRTVAQSCDRIARELKETNSCRFYFTNEIIEIRFLNVPEFVLKS